MQNNAIDLNAYFKRIEYEGETTPDLETLNKIIRAHVQTIPFENIDVILGKNIALDMPSIQKKLVEDNKGGYCFEHNSLLISVLQALGYSVKSISARVRIGAARDFIPPRTHLFARVELDEKSWLADVGVGGLSPTSALRLVTDTEQRTPHETRRIINDNGVYYHQAMLQDGWADVCEFTLEEMHPVDVKIANWYTSAHPESHFKSRILVARATPDGGRLTLLNDEFNVRSPDGNATKTKINNDQEFLSILSEQFCMNYDPQTQKILSEKFYKTF